MFRAKRATDILEPVNTTIDGVLRGDKQVRVRVVVDECELDGVVRRSACDAEAVGKGNITRVLPEVLQGTIQTQRLCMCITERNRTEMSTKDWAPV